jgi:hypothetical protein
MKWISGFKHPKSWTFEIEQQTWYNSTDQVDVILFCLFVHDESGKEVYDGQQDTLYWAKNEALEEFGVPLDSWKQIE